MVLLQVRCINHSQVRLTFTSTAVCKITSREARSTGLHLCGLYYPKIRELEQACLQQPTSTRSGLFAFLGSCYGQISFQRIVSIRITTLRDTHLVASRYNKVENTSPSRLMNVAQIHLCLSSL